MPLKILMFNNSGLGLVHNYRNFTVKNDTTKCILILCGFCQIGERSYGLKLREKRNISAIDSLISEKGPFLLECIVGIDENVYPMVWRFPINDMIGGWQKTCAFSASGNHQVYCLGLRDFLAAVVLILTVWL